MNSRNFILNASGTYGGSVAGRTQSTHRYIVWPCPECGGFITNVGARICGNTTCGGETLSSRYKRWNAKRYHKLQEKTLRGVEEGLHAVYACRPCDQCKSVRTRQRVCHTCIIVSEE